uniref:uncharacterized protein LOC105350860 n=1 Tax=Fragaria vesca subsp. vesca TaxID=101020 RepID=UPI0005CA6400|nr:PREDICTED: uncharacterized protein LOC105350860 [Fragaria vesca subsp. vesca]
MRMLYQKAKLVHADLSEYNGHLYMIAVSEAVELNDLSANALLCKYCLYVSVSSDCITGYTFTLSSSMYSDEMVNSYLNIVQYRVVGLWPGDLYLQRMKLQTVFVQTVKADAIQITSDEDTEDMYHKTITALEHAVSRVQLAPPKTTSDEENSSNLDSSPGKMAHNKKVARKYFKKNVKEVKRESQKHELPKAAKKRKKKLLEPCRTM